MIYPGDLVVIDKTISHKDSDWDVNEKLMFVISIENSCPKFATFPDDQKWQLCHLLAGGSIMQRYKFLLKKYNV